jgi:Domain of unknown function (DUF4188)
MAQILNKRMTAEIEGDFVVFLIGMRINKLWKFQSWLPAFMAMPRMLRELAQNKEMGLLDYHLHFGFPNTLVVQYWRSFEHLATYAGNRDAEHFPAWVAFNKRTGSNGDVGIWHETYRVAAGQHESIYNNMPAYGLGQAGTLVAATGRKSTAAGRIQA